MMTNIPSQILNWTPDERSDKQFLFSCPLSTCLNICLDFLNIVFSDSALVVPICAVIAAFHIKHTFVFSLFPIGFGLRHVILFF